MEDLLIDKTVKTPFIKAEKTGKIELSGISVPEDSFEFFEPLKKWLDLYEKTPANETVVTVNLDYFNTSSARILLNLFRILEAIHKSGKTVSINWYFEKGDIEMEEAGNDYKALLTCNFTNIAVEE